MNKLCRDPTSEKSDLFEFKIALSDNSDPEEFLLFLRNFQMNPEALETLTNSVKIHYLRMLLRGKALQQMGTLSVEVGSTTISHSNIFGV